MKELGIKKKKYVNMIIKTWKKNKMWYTINMFKDSDEEIVVNVRLFREFT